MTETPGNVNEADWAEQSLEVDPAAEAEFAGDHRVAPASSSVEANEADLVEQQTIAYVDDEDSIR